MLDLAPMLQSFFLLQPRDDLLHQILETFCDSPLHIKLPRDFSLAELTVGGKSVAEQQRLIKVPDDRQKGVFEHRKGDPRTLGKFTEETFYSNQSILFRMGSWVGSVTNVQKAATLRTAIVRFLLPALLIANVPFNLIIGSQAFCLNFLLLAASD